MTPEQFAELLRYIEENNSWKKMGEVVYEKHHIAVKYVRACFDSRDCTIWNIKFDPGDGRYIDFRIECEDDIKKVYAWLDQDTRKKKR